MPTGTTAPFSAMSGVETNAMSLLCAGVAPPAPSSSRPSIASSKAALFHALRASASPGSSQPAAATSASSVSAAALLQHLPALLSIDLLHVHFTSLLVSSPRAAALIACTCGWPTGHFAPRGSSAAAPAASASRQRLRAASARCPMRRRRPARTFAARRAAASGVAVIARARLRGTPGPTTPRVDAVAGHAAGARARAPSRRPRPSVAAAATACVERPRICVGEVAVRVPRVVGHLRRTSRLSPRSRCMHATLCVSGLPSRRIIPCAVVKPSRLGILQRRRATSRSSDGVGAAGCRSG